MSESCPKCGKLLHVVECCGGGIWYCENCKEYYYYGELISEDEMYSEIPHLEDSQEKGDKSSQ